MIQIKEDFAPYAPAPNVMTVINRSRTKRLPDPLDAQVLVTMGIPMATAPRVMQALYFLGLLNEAGNLTSAFLEIGKAPDDEAMNMLAELMQAAYNPIFVECDPTQSTKQELQNAFRRYEPRSQIDRMVTFFLALCRECGIVTGTPERVRGDKTKKPVVRKKPENNGTSNQINTQSAKNGNAAQGTFDLDSPLPQPKTKIPAALQLFFNELPSKWTQAKRDKWIQALTVQLDWYIEIEETDTGMSQKGSTAENSADSPSTILD